IFSQIIEYARSKGFKHVLEGTHRDDLKDHRPGLRALAELGVLSPFKELGFTKAQIRELARAYGLPNSDDPSAACLASRIPYGQPITREKLARVDAGEQFLRTELGVRQTRVRHDGLTARIEVEPGDIARLAALEARQAITAYFKELGFVYVALDLEGYRTGSLNI
ncbi:MAG: TIGR00268 family protein, partial [Candidatus Sumerlaeota bacterium]|nr:TIGR00268 family protein [Candidatus Sumerlaeota bacterium]